MDTPQITIFFFLEFTFPPIPHHFFVSPMLVAFSKENSEKNNDARSADELSSNQVTPVGWGYLLGMTFPTQLYMWGLFHKPRITPGYIPQYIPKYIPFTGMILIINH